MESNEGNYKKPRNPKQNANIFSKVTFCYTLPQFITGYKKELVETDLYETLEEHRSKKLGDQYERLWNQEKETAAKKNRTPSLMKVIFKAVGSSFMKLGLAHILYDVIIKISQALFLAQLIDYYTPDQTRITETDAYLYATGIVGCSLLMVLMMHPTVLEELDIGMKVRIGLCSIIYRKALRLNRNAYQQTTVGEIVNLLSNDVNRFDVVAFFLHYLWIGPLQTVVALFLMYRVVQVSAVYGVIVILLFIPLEMLLAKVAAKFRLKTATRTDERVRLMNEIILGIQVIKMYTWEKPFEEFVKAARRTEINAVKASSYIRGIYTSFIMFTSRTALFVTIICYVLPGNRYIDAKQVFLVTALFNVLRHSMTILLPQGLALMAETIVSVRRINKYLLYSEQEEAVCENDTNKNLTSSENSVISIKNGSAKWIETLKENVFTDLNLRVSRGNLVAVIGPVGSGKSSLMNVILHELPLLQGDVIVNGKISYASQEPWLFSSSVRQNILFGDEMDSARYKAVVKCCALETDFQLFPYGDKTAVGERGISLSGGQRARINLARAVYKSADIYLLDDPLSAVDTHVGKHIFERCIKQYLSNKTVVLITHQLQYLKEVDRIVILENGTLKAEGNYSDLTNVGLDFAQLLKSETEANQEDTITARRMSRKASVASETHFMDTATPDKVQEMRSEGTISGAVYKAYSSAAGNYFYLFLLVLLLISGQIAASFADYFISYWVNLQQDQSSLTYEQVNATFASLLTPDWIDARKFELTITNAIYIYTGLTVLIIILALSRTLFFFKMCMNASIELHRRMFNSIIFATMRFFNVNTSGRILNRFSKDMGVIDDRLPLTLVDTFQIFLSVLAIVTVVAIVNYWLVIPSLVIFVLFYFIRQFYLTTSRPIKRLEGVARSPVFGHLSASLEGLTTIRAFSAQNQLQNEFDQHQDLHSSAWYSFIATSIAFGYWLDLINVIYIASVTYIFLLMGSRNSTYGGNVGLAITQALGLTGMFQWGMKQSTELENQMTSVERVVEYITSIEPEPPLTSKPDKKPKETWPDFGNIRFVNLYLRYSPEDPPVLRNLNFTINSVEKVGVVGRTGAGKSSLISALFRLSDIEGQVIIDDIDVGEIGLHDLRSKISIIPQEPVLFSGSLRKNLDPFNHYNDEMLWRALEEVELKDAVNQKEEGLALTMSEGGKNFSLGQRQLVCLARAILQNNKVLIMDEATANVDLQTDALIQNTIRRKFAHCTVLTIAHRLNTIIDSDKVLVMNAGNMVEFDHPHILLQDHNGYFYKMVEKTGKSMASILTVAAENSYKKKIKVE